MTKTIDYAAEYDNSARVSNSDALISKFISDAAQFRETPGKIADLDMPYGTGHRNMMDIFWPDTVSGQSRSCPLVMFIHGGYWQRLDRSSFSHMAAGLNAKGFGVVVPSYTLCPDITIEGIIKEIRRACLIVYKKYGRRFAVVGHSAGGHLAACMMATDWESIHPSLPHDMVTSGMGISGIYDLRPLTHTPINQALNLDEESAVQSSPIHWVADGIQKFDAWVGSEESSEFHRQSQMLVGQWKLLGTAATYVSDPGTNHFTIIDALTSPNSEMVQRIVELAKEPVDKIALVEPDDDEIEAILNPKPPKKQSAKKKTDSKSSNGKAKVAIKTTKKTKAKTATSKTAATKPSATATKTRAAATKPKSTKKQPAKSTKGDKNKATAKK